MIGIALLGFSCVVCLLMMIVTSFLRHTGCINFIRCRINHGFIVNSSLCTTSEFSCYKILEKKV